jgi:thymidylate kinase
MNNIGMNMNINRSYYALEGLNGVGKSSVLNSLVSSKFFEGKVASHDLVVYHDPLPEFDPKQLQYFDASDEQLSAQLYCVSSYLSQSKLLGRSKHNKIIFSDRSVITTCVYYPDIEESWLINIHKYCLFPSVVFLLTAPEEDIKTRLLHRYGSVQCSEYDTEIKANKGLLGRYKSFFRSNPDIKLVEVENSTGTLDKAVQVILNYMEGKNGY